MGREALCTCVWSGEKGKVKVLLEPPELILRGEMRRRVPFAKMKQVRADGTGFGSHLRARWSRWNLAMEWRRSGPNRL